LIYRLVAQAEADFNDDRRAEKRFPFFHPVSLWLDGRAFSGFSRDISASGIGLLHDGELSLKEIDIIVAGHRQPLAALVVRCEPCGLGWYSSGCKFLESHS
jgi:hypothetical protein